MLNNFDEENIKELETNIEKRKELKSAYVMKQNSKGCEVNITETSRKICASLLLD